jgi:hypothetical protein
MIAIFAYAFYLRLMRQPAFTPASHDYADRPAASCRRYAIAITPPASRRHGGHAIATPGLSAYAELYSYISRADASFAS